MSRKKKWLLSVIGLCLLSIGYLVNVQWQLHKTAGKEAGMVSALHGLKLFFAEFLQANHRYPSVSELKALNMVLVDEVSREPFVFTSETFEKQTIGRRKPLVWQPHSYRTAPWPWGEVRQYVLFCTKATTEEFQVEGPMNAFNEADGVTSLQSTK